MARFRRVEAREAGPRALGLLVPPGRRTLVIVRPRALAWDLIPMRSGLDLAAATALQELGQSEAQKLVHELHRAMEEGSQRERCRVEVFSAPREGGFQVRARLGVVLLLACLRQPGQAYLPALFANLDDARNAAAAIAEYLCPREGEEREVYLNSRNFETANSKA